MDEIKQTSNKIVAFLSTIYGDIDSITRDKRLMSLTSNPEYIDELNDLVYAFDDLSKLLQSISEGKEQKILSEEALNLWIYALTELSTIFKNVIDGTYSLKWSTSEIVQLITKIQP